MNIQDFQETVWEHAKNNTRSMPWRESTDPYYVLVSELMLQQTQASRVVPKFKQFILQFPRVKTLADADLAQVLRIWSGLGYNRRAKFLWLAAKKVAEDFNGRIPDSKEALMSLPGVGSNTAGAILAYSFNQPVAFIETNIRSVFFYHFFSNQPSVTDKELMLLVEQTVDKEHPREWYWALMDYGAYLKKNVVKNVNQSAHYTKQAPLAGSIREMRGRILKVLTTKHSMCEEELMSKVEADDRFAIAVSTLVAEGLIKKTNNIYSL